MATDSPPLKRKTRVVLTSDLPGVPEGTAGKVGSHVGLELLRYRVAFDNGMEVAQVPSTRLVLEDEWDDVKAERERKAAAAEAGEDGEDGSDAAGGDTGEAGGGEAGGDGDAGGGAPQDDRLAALLARSKAAKERKAAE